MSSVSRVRAASLMVGSVGRGRPDRRNRAKLDQSSVSPGVPDPSKEVYHKISIEYQCREPIPPESYYLTGRKQSTDFDTDNLLDASKKISRSKSPQVSLARRGSKKPEMAGSASPTMRHNSMTPTQTTIDENTSLGAPSATTPAEKLKPRFQIWPEFSESDINNEKWDSAHGGKAKPAEKGKGPAPAAALYFDDPDGPLLLPNSLKPVEWKRPAEYFGEGRIPVIVDNENAGQFGFDLMKENEHILHSELIRWIITQVNALFQTQAVKASGNEPAEVLVSPDGTIYNYKPWEQIYAINKIGKGPNNPAYNPYGKYVVRLFWLGAWRKIFVDDNLPLDDEGNILLPRTQRPLELWPILLTKALIKVAALDYSGGSGTYEFGDFSPIHCLVGWLPQTIVLRREQKSPVWELFQRLLPEWKLPEPKKDVPPNEDISQDAQQTETEKLADAIPAVGGKDAATKGGKPNEKTGKEEKKEKEKRGDKGKEEQVVYEKPEVVVFASYYDATRKQPLQVTSLSDMANRSERLRQQGFSHIYSHPVLLSQFRSCPLEPPKPPEEIPAWKLIRPRVKKTFPKSEAPETEGEEKIEKPIEAIEVTSPFVSYKVNTIPIPQSTSRPTSALSRGSTRATTPNPVIDEFDENAPDWDVQEKIRKEEEAEAKRLAEEAALLAQVQAEQQAEAEKKESVDKKTSKKPVLKSPSKEKDFKEVKTTPQTSLTTMVEEKKDVEEPAVEEEVPRKKWMDLDDFLDCFHCIHVYHKVHTYHHSKTYQDLKNVNNRGGKEAGRKSAMSTVSTYSDDRAPLFVYVDNLKPTEVIFCMSALCRWNEAPHPPSSASGGTRSARDTGRPELETPETPDLVELVSQDTQVTIKPGQESISPGSLISEFHSWKDLRVGDPFKRMKTTGVKAISLNLPAGRQVLKMFMKAPFGYHLQILSAHPFLFGSEDEILPHLSKEPLRILDYASKLIQSLGKVIQNFSDPVTRQEVAFEYWKMHCPFHHSTPGDGKRHWEVYKEAFYAMSRDVLKTHNPSPDMAFALKVLNDDANTKNPLGLNFQLKPKKEAAPQPPPVKEKGGKHQQQQVQEPPAEPDIIDKLEQDPNSFFNRQIDDTHLIAVTKLQKCWRGYLARKIQKAKNPENKFHQKVVENLNKLWSYLDHNAESFGLQLLNNYIKQNPETSKSLDFFADKKHQLVFHDIVGNYPEQQPNTWFVVFRDIFLVKEDSGSFMLPKLYSNIPSLCLRIIDNDTNEEFPRTLGERTPGRVYRKNEKGYTFIGVARTGEQPCPSGKFKLRIIGNNKPLPEPKNDLNTNFHIKEIRDYFVPNKKNIIFRQSVKVLEEHVISLQVKLSKPDANFELSILDDEFTLLSMKGKGQIILPVFRFEKDIIAEGLEENVESGRSPSRQSSRGRKRGSSSARSREGKLSHSNSVASSIQDLTESKIHKYIIQATLLNDHWPMTASNWTFVENLKAQEKEDLKVVGKPKTPEPEVPKPEVAKKEPVKAKPPPKGKDVKGGKGEKGKTADKGDSRPESVTFDEKKAHWMLRVFSDASAADDIEIKKDTERIEQIKAMKRAWEELQPGRAEQAKQSRLRYLNSHYIKNPDAPEETEPAGDDAATDEDKTVEALQKTEDVLSTAGGIVLEEPLLLEPPPQPPPKEILPPLDKTPYLRGDPSKARYIDYATRVQEEDIQHQQDLQNFEQFMEQWDSMLEAERRDRNEKKKNHMEFVRKLQNITDSYREAYFRKREAFRWKLIEEERKRQEELLAKQQAELAAQQSEADANKGKEKGKRGSARRSPGGSAKKGKKK